MTDGFASIIAQLEQKKAAIERALAALRSVGESESGVPAVRDSSKSPEGPSLRSIGQRKRWAAKKAAVTTKTTRAKGGMTPEGRSKLAEAMKKRWAVKQAGSDSTRKSAGRPKTAA